MPETSTDLRAARQHGYETPRPDVVAHVPASARNILELGCSTGALGAAVKRRQDCRILGVELDAGYGGEAADRLDRVVVADAESFAAGEIPPEAPFDCLIAADVLEHLVDPWTTLTRACSWLAPGAKVIVSVPNVLYYAALAQVIRDQRWPREDQGIFDRTHLRWFSVADATDLLVQAGLDGSGIEVDPRYWTDGRRLRLLQRLARTPLAPYLAPQYVLTGLKR